MDEFVCFIVDMDLMNVPFFYGKFTWVKPYGSVTIGFDRFLMSELLVEARNIDKKGLGRRDFCHTMFLFGSKAASQTGDLNL